MEESVLVRVSDSVDILATFLFCMDRMCSIDSISDISLLLLSFRQFVIAINCFGIRAQWLHIFDLILLVLESL